ncbi:MAG: hypothetical protein ABR905_11215 [Terracidiphilus sp.]
MKSSLFHLGLLIFSVLLLTTADGQQITVKSEPNTVTYSTSEPGIIPLAQLFRMADAVAVVRVVSGDTESYNSAIYKAIVVTGLKGTTEGQTLYFGPYIGERLGEKSVVFLRRAKKPATPKDAKSSAFGTVNYFEVFNQGYSSMPIAYECVFDGTDISQSCDDGVRVCTDYIVLPKGTRAFSREKDDPPFGCGWVRESKFIALLNELASGPGPISLQEMPR